VFAPQCVAARLVAFEQPRDRRMIDGLAAVVVEQVLLADIGDIAALGILGEQVVKGLVLARAQILGDRFIPVVAVGEDRIDVEDHAAEIEHPVTHDIADREARVRYRRRALAARAAIVRGGEFALHIETECRDGVWGWQAPAWQALWVGLSDAA